MVNNIRRNLVYGVYEIIESDRRRSITRGSISALGEKKKKEKIQDGRKQMIRTFCQVGYIRIPAGDVVDIYRKCILDDDLNLDNFIFTKD